MPRDSHAEILGPRWSYGKRGYALSQSLKQLKRRPISSLLTILVLGITLALPVILYFGSSTLQQLSSRSLQGESLTIYLSTDLSDIRGAELAEQWRTREGIRDTRFVSRTEALQQFQENHTLNDAIVALGKNPLPAAVIVYPSEDFTTSARVESLAANFRNLDTVERVQFDLRWVKRLQAVVSLIGLVGGLLAGFLTLTALLVIGNTIRLELLRRQSEMEVANLLGASAWFMNRPILFTGALYGLLGGLVASTIALFAFNTLRQPADTLSSLYDTTLRLIMPNTSQILLVLGVSVLLGIVGALSSLYRSANHLSPNSTSASKQLTS